MKTSITHLLPDSQFTCFVIHNALDHSTCTRLLSDELKQSFKKANGNYPTNYRNNDRHVVDDPELASYLFEKIHDYLPPVITTVSAIASENGSWVLSQLNNRIRFCRYSAQQYFHRHLDGIHYRSQTEQSKLTFMIYLNDAEEFQGGRTLFYKSKEAQEIWASYTPCKGDVIVFDHNVWHEGEELSAGEKFVLRSDILYKRKNAEAAVAPFQGHLGYIWKLLRLSPEIMLSAGRDKMINVWNQSGQLLQSLAGHQNSILCLEKIDEHSFLSGSRDRRILLWKRKSEGESFEIAATFEIHKATVLSLCYLGNGLFASTGGDNSIFLTQLETGEITELKGHSDWVWQVLRLDENHIVSCSEDGTLKIWNYHSGACVQTSAGHCAIVSMTYNFNLKRLFGGNIQGEITMWEIDARCNALEIARWNAHSGIVRTILLLDDLRIATGGEDNKIKIWETQTASCLQEMLHHNFVQSLELSTDGKLCSASYDGTIGFWNFQNQFSKQSQQ